MPALELILWKFGAIYNKKEAFLASELDSFAQLDERIAIAYGGPDLFLFSFGIGLFKSHSLIRGLSKEKNL